MLNRSILIGRLTADPTLKYTPNGVGVATFTLAVDRPFTSQGGDKETDFIPVVVWRQQAENCATYLRKGRLAAIEGRIQVRSWETENGRRYATEVVADNVRFLESPNNKRSPEEEPDEPRRKNNGDPFAEDGKPIDISDDDLPF